MIGYFEPVSRSGERLNLQAGDYEFSTCEECGRLFARRATAGDADPWLVLDQRNRVEGLIRSGRPRHGRFERLT